jgi:alkaline phosphatase D
VVTGQNAFRTRDREDGFEIYRSMLDLEPSFFVHTGDIVYYDRLGKTLDLARYHWQYTYGLPTNVAFHRRVPSYFIKDDHDVWQDDCWPGMRRDNMHELTFAQGQAVFREQVPMGERIWRTVRWGRDLQIWLVEGRDFRSPNDTPDGPDKTIWGAEQKAWFKETVAASDATFRVLVSPTPIVGPDRPSKRDNHSNSNFAHEGDELRSFISSQGNMIVICGDRHWQYASVDPKTGLREYSSGPHTDAHAGGFSEDQRSPMHRFLRIRGGFLSGTVERQDGAPTLTIRFHDVNGAVQYSERRRR